MGFAIWTESGFKNIQASHHLNIAILRWINLSQQKRFFQSKLLKKNFTFEISPLIFFTFD